MVVHNDVLHEQQFLLHQDSCNIMWMNIIKIKGNNTRAFSGIFRSVNRNPSTVDIFPSHMQQVYVHVASILSSPISSKKSIAAPKPIAPAMIGVPPSNFQGSSFQVESYKSNKINHFSTKFNWFHFFKKLFFPI